MSTPIGPLITKALQRVRDPQGGAHSRDFVRKILSYAQRTLNPILVHSVASASLTVEPGQMFYSVSGSLSTAINIIDVVHRGRSLHRATLDELNGTSSTWPRQHAAQITSYAPIGKDLLILYPALTIQDVVTVHYVKDTGILNNEAETISLTKDGEPLLSSLVEVILLIKQHDFGEAQKLLENIGKPVQGVTGG